MARRPTTPQSDLSLGEALPIECARVRKLRDLYLSLEGGGGRLAAHFMEQSLQAADRAMIEGDIVAMIAAYKRLQDHGE